MHFMYIFSHNFHKNPCNIYNPLLQFHQETSSVVLKWKEGSFLSQLAYLVMHTHLNLSCASNCTTFYAFSQNAFHFIIRFQDLIFVMSSYGVFRAA